MLITARGPAALKVSCTVHASVIVTQLTGTRVGASQASVGLRHVGIPLPADSTPKDATGDAELSGVPHAETWAAMEGLVQAGLTRNIGVSNFSLVGPTPLLWAAILPGMRRRTGQPVITQHNPP